MRNKTIILNAVRNFQVSRHEAIGMLIGIGYTEAGARRMVNRAMKGVF